MKILLLHGLFGSPEEMKPIVEPLEKLGYLVNSPLLPGHNSPEDLRFVDKADYYNFIDQFFQKNNYDIIIGHSMGGLLATYAASKYQFEKLILISTPYKYNRAEKMLSDLFSGLHLKIKTQKPEKIFFDSMLAKEHSSHEYFYFNSVAVYFNLLQQQTKLFAKIKTDKNNVLAINSVLDKVVKYNLSMAKVNDIKKIRLEKSGHVILKDFQSEYAIREIIKFIKS